MASRRLNWVSSVDERNAQKIAQLEERLKDFYSKNADYYGSIDFTSDNWINPKEIGYQQILTAVRGASSICEVGCGSANMLSHFPEFQQVYTGCDFSEPLLMRNRDRFTKASFSRILVPNVLPFPANTFDLVFSVFVIEHSTNPTKFLSECLRVLKDSGTLIILCPDFLGRNRMTSQRAGWSHGTALQKIRTGRYVEAAITLYDNRIRIPLYCLNLKEKIRRKFGFHINLDPVVFEDPFTPDVDAVYITSKMEMVAYLNQKMNVCPNDPLLLRYEREHGLIFIQGAKRSIG